VVNFQAEKWSVFKWKKQKYSKHKEIKGKESYDRYEFTVLIVIISLRKNRPSMPTAQGINDEMGRRILFTVISNNPTGSEICKKPLKVEEIPHKIFHRKNILYLDFVANKDFLKDENYFDSVSEWTLKGQQSFVAKLNDSQLTKEGTYKLTFYTSDGKCSHNISGYFGLLSNLLYPGI
jgi:hypothetical protein